MWREPSIHEVDAPKEYKELMNASIYFNRKGVMRHASDTTIYQYTGAVLLGSIMLGGMISLILGLAFQIPPGMILNVIITIGIILALTVTLSWFVYWGWYKYEEAWYHFDEDDEIFTVILPTQDDWERFEIPYSTVDKIEWNGGSNGYATIHAGGFRFDTTRAGTERYASVTEMWSNIARFDTRMVNWPITLICPECEREFGHHIGTAQCPFDELLLIDPDVKGRIDPEEIHPDDKERV